MKPGWVYERGLHSTVVIITIKKGNRIAYVGHGVASFDGFGSGARLSGEAAFKVADHRVLALEQIAHLGQLTKERIACFV